MANKFRGETAFEAAGQTYTFRLGTNELVRLKEKLGTDNPFEAMSKGDGDLASLRTIVHTGLMRNHPELTEEQAGDIIDEIGFSRLGDMAVKSLEALNEEGTPKSKAAGTGPVSLPPVSVQG